MMPLYDIYLIAVDSAMELSLRYEAARILQVARSSMKKKFVSDSDRKILQRAAWRRQKNRGKVSR